jgi:hypothetical protein
VKGIMIKCLQCNTVSVYKTDRGDGSRCPICKGYTIPQGECNIVEERVEISELWGPDGLIETICTPIER